MLTPDFLRNFANLGVHLILLMVGLKMMSIGQSAAFITAGALVALCGLLLTWWKLGTMFDFGMPDSSIPSDAEISKLAIEYFKGHEITMARIRSDEFMQNADAADLDEIDLEESLARMKLFRALEKRPELGKPATASLQDQASA